MNLCIYCRNVFLCLFSICLLLENSSGKKDFSLHVALKKGKMSDQDLEKLVNSTSVSDLNTEDNDGRTPIFLSASRGNARIFKLIQDRGGEGNETNKHGETLLHHAVIGGDLVIIENVLELYEVSLSAQDSEGNTVMHYIALNKTKKNNVIVCEMLLEEGSTLSIKNNDNRTPFHLAVINQLYEILEKMLEINPNGVLIQDENGHTPLQIALDKKFKTIFQLLINYSVNPFEKDFDGRTVIHNAVLKEEIEFIEIALLSNKTFRGEANRIISYQEGLGYQDVLNYTALHWAAEKGIEELLNITLSFKKCETNQRQCKELVLKTTNYYDDTILHGAVRGGNSAILQQLLDHLDMKDDYIDGKNKDGHTALHLAVQDGKTEMVESLLIKGANSTVKDNNDFHPLGLAASFGKLELIHVFKLHIVNKEDYNATELLGFAIANGNDENVIEELLVDLEEKTNPPTFLVPAKGLDNEIKEHCNKNCTITIANCEINTEEQIRASNSMRIITADHEKFIKELAEEDEDESSDLFASKPTMLNYALFFKGKLSTVEKILECSGTLAICEVCKINEAWSPIDIAAFRGKLDILQYFIKECKKCNVSLIEIRDNQEQTVMHKAAWGGQCGILTYLHKEQRANINDKDKWDRTPLHIAALRGYKEALLCILKLNSRALNWEDKYAFTPLHLAEIYGHHNFFTALQRTSITVDPQFRYKMKFPGTQNRLRNHTDTIHFLLENGANPNAQDGTLGWSTLHWASANGDIEVVKMLVNNKIKAKVNLPSKSDQTPMYLARFWGRVDVYNYLKTLSAVW